MKPPFPFVFERKASVRAMAIDGDPWFVAKDVAEVLGYTNTRKAVRDHCKAARPVGGNESFPLDPQTAIIPERDVYRLVMRSNLPAAERFEEWVVGEVLPGLRRMSGYYATPATPKSFAEALRLAADQQERIEQQAVELALAAPKVEFVDRYVESSGSKGFRQVAKLLRAKEPEFRQFLTERRIMYRLGGEWVAYQPHIDAGRFEVKTGTGDNEHAFTQAKFTPKGVAWVSQLWNERELTA